MPRALIAGAGVGGLTTALCLARDGWQVQLFEQAPALSEIGAGLQLGANAGRVLAHLGLLEPLRARACEPEAIEARAWHSGQRLMRLALTENGRPRWGQPYLQLHRSDLQSVLRDAVAATPAIQLQLDATVADVDTAATRVQAAGRWHGGDLIVGADGLHSRVREALFGPARPRYTGQSAWRLMLPAERLPSGLVPPAATLWMGPGKHLVHYYVRGGAAVNCVGVIERADWSAESWTERADFGQLKRDFEDAHRDLRTLIDAAADQPCYRWALLDRPPLPRWHRDAAVLLGDACHPTLPFLAQGAAMAIEDAAVLARCLRGAADIPDALASFQAQRYQRTRRIQATSRRNGRIYHLRGPAAAARNLALRGGLAGPGRVTDWLYSYDPLTPR